jgi:hypothetical protein
MAGSGKKTFTAGDVLTASDVNNYLMDQTVMVFGGTAARASAIPTPSEGMFAVTTDNDQVDYYDGTAWLAGLPFGAWQSWSPVLSSGWANGNGVYSDARYVQIGKTVLARATFTVGSTTTKGTGMVISLPVPQTGVAHPVMNTNTIGGSAGRILFFTIESGNGVAYAMDTGNPYLIRANITATVPATWATNDIIRFSFIYQAA